MSRERLDRVLEARGLMPSRARARDAILRGTVFVNGAQANKPHMGVAANDEIRVDDPAAHYVSRSALKLVAGLEAANIAVTARTCVDAGASTGGFTQVLLERGAAQVTAIEVGHGQFAKEFDNDPRVRLFEHTNIADITEDMLAGPLELLVSDISFVSLKKVIGPALKLCAPGAHAALLFKPQFEVGREFVGRGGIVKDVEATNRALAGLVRFTEDHGFALLAEVPSPIAGGDGNQETILVFEKQPGPGH